MPRRAATIESLPMAFEVVKQMQADGLERGEGYRPLGRRSSAARRPTALSAARCFADAWEQTCPKAVACLRSDLDELLTCFRCKRPMGIFQDRTSMNRILFAIFTHENKRQGIATPFPLTHNN